jgi:predicted transport protein
VTKYFAFFKNFESRKELVEKIYSIVTNDSALLSKAKKLIGSNELYKYFSDAVENSQNILLVIDEKKKELPEIMNTYTDTWGTMVKLLVIRKFTRKGDSLFLMDPEFETIEYSLESGIDEVDRQELEISEEFHLEKVSEDVKDIYDRLKEELLAINPDLVFNPQKYYISVINIKNVLFYKVRKKKIRIIVMLPEELVRERVEQHAVKSLSEGVQNFYNGKCCAVDVDSTEGLDEIVELVRPLVKKEDEGDNV